MKSKLLLSFLLGIFFLFLIQQLTNSKKEEENNDVKIISHEIKKLNKLIVLEQGFSEFYTHENSVFNDYIKDYFNIDDKKVILHVSAKAQAIYNMKELDLELDSVQKKIIINHIPKVELQVIPDIEIYHINQGLLNSYSEKELQKITQTAKNKIKEQAEKSDIKQRAKKQLIENLSELFFLSKVYNWEIIDNTNTLFPIKN
ncbi:MAG: DUF4230 domain-containing protein [Flavobacteriales bacterium]|nr:DUF4230 domain-containing protein [Flavobacteriales bacterium]